MKTEKIENNINAFVTVSVGPVHFEHIDQIGNQGNVVFHLDHGHKHAHDFMLPPLLHFKVPGDLHQPFFNILLVITVCLPLPHLSDNFINSK